MANTPQEHRAQSTPQGYLRNPLTLWAAATLATITVCVGAGMLFQRYLHREFLGEETKLIHLCKQNPTLKKPECEELLARRSSKSPKQQVLAHPIPAAQFQLSTDSD